MIYNKRGASACGNRLTVPIERVNAAVLSTLADDVLEPAVVDAVIDGVLEALEPHSQARTGQVTTSKITGEVVLVDGNILLVRIQPSQAAGHGQRQTESWTRFPQSLRETARDGRKATSTCTGRNVYVRIGVIGKFL